MNESDGQLQQLQRFIPANRTGHNDAFGRIVGVWSLSRTSPIQPATQETARPHMAFRYLEYCFR
jgi:hypothetical protein